MQCVSMCCMRSSCNIGALQTSVDDDDDDDHVLYKFQSNGFICQWHNNLSGPG